MTSKLLLCPACGAVNRVPEARLGENPKCGKCHARIFPDHPVRLGRDNFLAYIQKKTSCRYWWISGRPGAVHAG